MTSPTLDWATLSDEAICQQFTETGNRQYIGELYRRYGHLVYGACLKYLKDKEASKDVLSLIFEKLIHKIPETDIQQFNAWIYTVIRSECLMRLRKEKNYDNLKENIKHLEENKATFAPKYADNAQIGKALTIKASSQEEMVIEAINLLKKEQQTCIKLFYFENRSYKDIVDTTGYTEKQVKSFLQNAKRNIKKLLEVASINNN